MKRTSVALLFILIPQLAATPARAQVNAGQEPFLERMEVDIVNVDVRVTDGSGKPVTGLRKQDFELLEDGKPMSITNFEAVNDREPGHASATGSTPKTATQSPIPIGPAAAPLPPLPEEQRLHLVFYFDNFNLQPAHRARVLGPLRKFIEERLAPTDRIMLVTYDQGVHIRLPFTSDRAAISVALDKISTLAPVGDLQSQRRSALRNVIDMREARSVRGNSCDSQILQPVEAYARATRQEVLRSIRGLALLVDSLAGLPGRKALLHVSDGLQLTPGADLYEVIQQFCGGTAASGLKDAGDAQLTGDVDEQLAMAGAKLDPQTYSTVDDFRKLTDRANAQGVPFYTLQAGGLEGPISASADLGLDERALQIPAVDSTQRANLRDSLNFMATETGGRAIFDANDPTPDLAAVRGDFESYYSLGYSPSHHGDGKEHRIEVRAGPRGLRLRYRQNYRDQPFLERAVDRTLATLLHGFEDNPLAVTVTTQEATPAQAGGWQMMVRLRIPLFKLAILNRGDAFDGHLRLLVLTRDGDDRVSPVRQVDVPIHIPKTQALTALGQYYAYDLALQLPPGPHRLAVAVRDEYGGGTSYLGKDLEVGEGPRAASHRVP